MDKKIESDATAIGRNESSPVANSASRRQFMKAGGATVASLISWSSLSEIAKAVDGASGSGDYRIIWKKYRYTNNNPITITGTGNSKGAALQSFNNSMQSNSMGGAGKATVVAESEPTDVTNMTQLNPPEVKSISTGNDPVPTENPPGVWTLSATFQKESIDGPGTQYIIYYWK